MTTWLVTRHTGALDWREAGIAFDVHVTHLDLAAVNADDTLIDSRSVHLAGEGCTRGARYLNLSLD
jgi:CRISPR-associated protein Csx16